MKDENVQKCCKRVVYIQVVLAVMPPATVVRSVYCPLCWGRVQAFMSGQCDRASASFGHQAQVSSPGRAHGGRALGRGHHTREVSANNTVASWAMAPKGLSPQNLGICYPAWQRGLRQCDQVRVLRWGENSGLSGWAGWNHRGPLWEEGRRVRVRGDGTRQAEVGMTWPRATECKQPPESRKGKELILP